MSIAVVDNQMFVVNTLRVVQQCGTPSMSIFPVDFRFGNIGFDRSAEKSGSIETSRSISPEVRVDTSTSVVRQGHIILQIATVDTSIEGYHLRVDMGVGRLVCELLQVLIEFRGSDASM